MAKKITLTVTESLSAQLDAWRSSFNLSKLFQDALAEAIHKKEELQRLLKGTADLTQTVERLRAEKKDSLRKVEARGKVDGGAWAAHAHYDDLTAVVGALPVRTPQEDAAVAQWLETDGSQEMTDAYRCGWQTGVAALWDMVKDQLEE